MTFPEPTAEWAVGQQHTVNITMTKATELNKNHSGKDTWIGAKGGKPSKYHTATSWNKREFLCLCSGEEGDLLGSTLASSKVQRESNMHRIEVHHFASPFASNFPVGETVDSYRRSCRNSRTFHREGGFSGTGKGPIPLREKGGKGDTKW